MPQLPCCRCCSFTSASHVSRFGVLLYWSGRLTGRDTKERATADLKEDLRGRHALGRGTGVTRSRSTARCAAGGLGRAWYDVVSECFDMPCRADEAFMNGSGLAACGVASEELKRGECTKDVRAGVCAFLVWCAIARESIQWYVHVAVGGMGGARVAESCGLCGTGQVTCPGGKCLD